MTSGASSGPGGRQAIGADMVACRRQGSRSIYRSFPRTKVRTAMPPPDPIRTVLDSAQARAGEPTSHRDFLAEALCLAACLAPITSAQAKNTAATPTSGNGGREPAVLPTITPTAIEEAEKVHAVHLGLRRPAAKHVLGNVVVFMLAYFTTAILVPSSGAAIDAPESVTASQLTSDLGLRIADTPVRERSQWHPPHKILLSPALFRPLSRRPREAAAGRARCEVHRALGDDAVGRYR